MRHWLLHGIALVSFGACSACALEATPRPDPQRFAGEIAAFSKREPVKGGIVFAGSSSIRMWPRLKQDFPDLPIVNHGFGGCVSNDLIVYFDPVVAREEPRLLVIYSGNDLDKNLRVEEAFHDYTRFIDMARERFPKLRVIVNSVKIAASRAHEIPRVHELNGRLEAWAADREWVRYLDSSSYLADAAGQPIPDYYQQDQLHLSPAGYVKWKEILDPVLREEWAKAN